MGSCHRHQTKSQAGRRVPAIHPGFSCPSAKCNPHCSALCNNATATHCTARTEGVYAYLLPLPIKCEVQGMHLWTPIQDLSHTALSWAQVLTCFFSTLTAGGRENSGAFTSYSRASSLTLAKTCNRCACIRNICQHGVRHTAARSGTGHAGPAMLHLRHFLHAHRVSRQLESQMSCSSEPSKSNISPFFSVPKARCQERTALLQLAVSS